MAKRQQLIDGEVGDTEVTLEVLHHRGGGKQNFGIGYVPNNLGQGGYLDDVVHQTIDSPLALLHSKPLARQPQLLTLDH
jgi:hypothetical protein